MGYCVLSHRFVDCFSSCLTAHFAMTIKMGFMDCFAHMGLRPLAMTASGSCNEWAAVWVILLALDNLKKRDKAEEVVVAVRCMCEMCWLLRQYWQYR